MERNQYLSIAAAVLISIVILCGAWQLGSKREFTPPKDEEVFLTATEETATEGIATEETATEETAGVIALGITRRRPYLSIAVAALILTVILCVAWQLGSKKELAPLKDEALIWTSIRSAELRKELHQTFGLGEKLAANTPAGWEETARGIMRDERLLSVFFLMGNEDMILQRSNGVLRAERWRPDADELLDEYLYERMQKSLLPEIVEYEYVGADEMRAPAFAFLFPLVREGKMVGVSGFIKESSKLMSLMMDEEEDRQLFIADGAGRIILKSKHHGSILWEELWRLDPSRITTMLDKENRLHASDFNLYLPEEGVSAIRNAMRQPEGGVFIAPATPHDAKGIYAVVPFDAGLKEPLYLVTLKYPLDVVLNNSNLLVAVSILWISVIVLISVVFAWRILMSQGKLNPQEVVPELKLSPEIKAQVRKQERLTFYLSLLTLLLFIPGFFFMRGSLKEANAAISRGDVEAAKPHIKKMKRICAVSVILGAILLMLR